jgi:protein-S-isoprenylcysteine O-methyltransferase Ste14
MVTVFLATAGTAVLLFASAGRLDWSRGWIYLAVRFACVAASAAFLLVARPELLNARGRRHKDTKFFDKVIVAVYVTLIFTIDPVAGLDAVRFGWSSMSGEAAYAGMLLSVLGEALIIGSMAVNPFLETTVRVQKERGHQVVSSGPYRLVRHPMYVGMILQNLAAPLVLGSWWAYLPVGLTVFLLAARACLEDRTLQEELAGYTRYVQRTPYLLLPGVW